MDTKIWLVKDLDKESLRENPGIQEAAGLLANGQLVAFPTETVYGLGADARSTEAVQGIYEAKGRPSDNPLIVHIADMAMLEELVLEVDEVSRRLARDFWPGPLTLVLPVRPGAVSPRVTAGLDTVAVRMPAHPVALALIAAAGVPVAAPSANRSGRPSPTLAEHVREDLAGRIAGIVDAGAAGVGLESTVAEAGLDGRVHVLRPGGVSPAQLERAAGCAVVLAGEHVREEVEAGAGDAPAREGQRGGAAAGVGAAGGAAPMSGPAASGPAEGAFQPRAPGMKYTHYAPRGSLTLVQGDNPQEVGAWIRLELERARSRGERTGVLAPVEHLSAYTGAADAVVPCGSLQDLDLAAKELFTSLRRFDELGLTCMYAEAYPEEGIGLALMNRLRKAAGYRIVQV